jgi:hypothetical protein
MRVSFVFFYTRHEQTKAQHWTLMEQRAEHQFTRMDVIAEGAADSDVDIKPDVCKVISDFLGKAVG